VAVAGARVRGTQSFVGTLSQCWKRPSLTALEIAWRWLFGTPAALLVVYKTLQALRLVAGGSLDPARFGLDRVLLNDPVGALSADPVGASTKFANALALARPGVEHFAVWLVPLLLVGWVIQSSVGRTLVLRRYDPSMHIRLGTLMVLQAVRVCTLAAIFWSWFAIVGWASRVAISGPIAARDEPNLILYCGIVIVASLALFTGWAFVSWVVGAAPLLAMQRNLGPAASLRASLALGPVRAKLAEINLVLGIVKIALIVLAMVFSATPLPFQSVTTPEFLAWWWAGVAVLYLVWSDFFHVARLVGYLDLLRAYAPQAE
jgi:hypothetical protein